MKIIKNILVFLIIVFILIIGAGFIAYNYFEDHVIASARTSEGRALRQKAEELGLYKRSKQEKWVDRYDYTAEFAQNKKNVLVNASYRGMSKLYNYVKNGLYWLNPFKKRIVEDVKIENIKKSE